jgi:hypothetical protein
VIFLALLGLAKACGDTLYIPADDRAYGADVSQHGEDAYFRSSTSVPSPKLTLAAPEAAKAATV